MRFFRNRSGRLLFHRGGRKIDLGILAIKYLFLVICGWLPSVNIGNRSIAKILDIKEKGPRYKSLPSFLFSEKCATPAISFL